jgi:hypothetical protein
MAFESLSYRYTFPIADMPGRWLPLIHLYDPDLPLFPILYFHSLPTDLPAGQRPARTDRIFGYVQRINVEDDGSIRVGIVTNKDLRLPANAGFKTAAEQAIRERLGLADPVTLADVANTFSNRFASANPLLAELWNRVVPDAYGGRLPFGRLWDEVMGFARFVASWNSQSGRKGELIQTHYFASRFGTRIQASGDNPQVDFYLLPTFTEFTDPNNPLADFPAFQKLLAAADRFRNKYAADVVHIDDGCAFSKFRPAAKGKFDTAGLMREFGALAFDELPAAVEAFNAFGKGPQRTVLALLMLSDLRHRRWSPTALTPTQLADVYWKLGASYQSPKVIHIYAQQCCGNVHAIPIDTWIQSFLDWPLMVHPTGKNDKARMRDLFTNSNGLGKAERLLWVAGQARKVHSSACNDALWCLKLSSTRKPRGANPLACNICVLRDRCPAYAAIAASTVSFNNKDAGTDYFIFTSKGDNQTPNQQFHTCFGLPFGWEIEDDFSPKDDADGFAPYPQPGHDGSPITVAEFVQKY